MFPIHPFLPRSAAAIIRHLPHRGARGAAWLAVAATLVLVGCGKSGKRSPAAAPDAAATTGPAPTAAAADSPNPLPPETLTRLAAGCALVRIPDEPDHTGLLHQPPGPAAANHCWVLCDAPAKVKSVRVAYQTKAGVTVATATRVGELSTGLAVFSFFGKGKIDFLTPTKVPPGETVRIFRLSGEGHLDPAEKARLTAVLADLKTQQDALALERDELRKSRNRPPGPGGAPPGERVDPARDSQLSVREHELRRQASDARNQLATPITELKLHETTGGAAVPPDGKPVADGILVTASGLPVAILGGNAKLDLVESLTPASAPVKSAALQVSGSGDTVLVSCELTADPLVDTSSLAMVAVTTFELESAGTGTIQERLARVEPVRFNATSSRQLHLARSVPWNRRKTTLWLKVFDVTRPDPPILNEEILLDFSDRLLAKWAKPPSPLIRLPEPPPDVPENLVREKSKLDAGGVIRDLIPAGDGSVMLVQIDQPPFWRQLDLKTGRWLDAKWQATEHTLAAAQAGRIYLIDRLTKIVEVRDLATGKLDSRQLLPVAGPITAVAAPMTSASQPLLVVADREAVLLDPVRFEVLASGLPSRRYFVPPESRFGGTPVFEPSTVWARAAADGASYGLLGCPTAPKTATNAPPRLMGVALVVDATGLIQASYPGNRMLPLRGRRFCDGFPDHGGGSVTLQPASVGGGFPTIAGPLRFRERDQLATLNCLPGVSLSPDLADGPVRADRRLYYDSGLGMLLVPDERQLHLYRLNLPATEPGAPDFMLGGEVFRIPLPVGSGHKVTGEPVGSTRIGAAGLEWTLPKSAAGNSAQLQLEWTGELGSPLTRTYRVAVHSQSQAPELIGPEGAPPAPLRRRGIIPDSKNLIGLAGAGQVAILSDGSAVDVWSLATCEHLFSLNARFKTCFGDADRLYILTHDGQLSSYDLQTGKQLRQTKLAGEIRQVVTGAASRGPLLAFEQNGLECYLLQIHRDTLQTVIADFPAESRALLVNSDFKCNATGSVFAAWRTLVRRQGTALTLKPQQGSFTAIPDAAGKYLVDDRQLIEIGANPPRSVSLKDLPGVPETAVCKLDAAGAYLMVELAEPDAEAATLSVRAMADPASERFRVRLPFGRTHGPLPEFVSSSHSLIYRIAVGSDSGLAVFALDPANPAAAQPAAGTK